MSPFDPPPPTPPTSAEIRHATEVAATAAIDVLRETIDELDAITAMTNAQINQNPAAVIKDLTREVKTVTRQTLRLARLVVGAFDVDDDTTP
jgi:hypothetical protein